MKNILLVVAIVLLSACTRTDNAREVLDSNGYTNIQMHGYGWFVCDNKDTFVDSFTATSPNGKTVTGAVCSGFIKGSTIRFK